MVKTPGKSGKTGGLQKVLITATAAAAIGCSAQLSYADIGIPDSAIKLPGSTEIDRSLQRLNQAWDAIQDLDSIKAILGESRNSLSAAKRVSSAQMETVKFQHYYNGLEVVGSMAMHQVGQMGSGVLDRLAHFNIDTNARLAETDAMAIAKSLAGDRELSSKPALKILPDAEGNNVRLVYWVDLDAVDADGAREVIIDANSGEVIGNISKNIEIAPINVFSAKNQGSEVIENGKINPATGRPELTSCTIRDLATGAKNEITADLCEHLKVSDLPPNRCQIVIGGSPVKVLPQNCDADVVNSSPRPGADASAARAARNTQAVLTYYLTHHKRNSYDNRGAPITAVVHGGIGFNNAYWNTQQNIMVYGDGDGKTFGDFTQALDVAGHEMTHGVVNGSAKLLGMGESGALNEAYADFFGKMIANDGDWAIGRKLYINHATAKGVRNLATPGVITFCAQHSGNRCLQTRPYPTKISEKMTALGTCDGTNDNCYVHINSTIHSHAAYLVVQAIGQAKAEQLYYATLTNSLRSTDDIRSASQAAKLTCSRIFDRGTCAKVDQAYAQAGL